MSAKYCVSILPESEDMLVEQIQSEQEADLIEIRCDYLDRSIDLHHIRRLCKKPLIITVRHPSEGGFWDGSEEDRIGIYRKAVDTGIDYIDVEWRNAAGILSRLPSSHKTRLILSCHSTENKLKHLIPLFQKMLEKKADIYKFVYTVNDINENLHVLELIQIPRQENAGYIVHGMGVDGQISRILGSLQGNKWTYVSADNKPATAAGQQPLHIMKNIFFLHERTSATRLLGLLGYPVKQSSGWRLHNRLMHRIRNTAKVKPIDFIYLNFPAKNFHSFWDHWKYYLYGLSVTIPYKQDVISVLDRRGETVELSGVCNTMVKRNNLWYGFNTDMLAIYELFMPYRELLKRGVLIYGTGATTRSSAAAIRELKAGEIFICGRNELKGRHLADEFNLRFVPQNLLETVRPAVIIQTTPVGMFPDTDEMPPLEGILPGADLVFDVIFNPVKTGLLKKAAEYDCETISGDRMYLLQARKQFEIFAGIPLDPDVLLHEWNNLD
ncbi:MAG: type I 3-dehydroquinate dehydratase [Calditrichaeota bacterium]|nr:type I 3-dehydroquinate dehydratase [Calditrichota bacterium]